MLRPLYRRKQSPSDPKRIQTVPNTVAIRDKCSKTTMRNRTPPNKSVTSRPLSYHGSLLLVLHNINSLEPHELYIHFNIHCHKLENNWTCLRAILTYKTTERDERRHWLQGECQGNKLRHRSVKHRTLLGTSCTIVCGYSKCGCI
jgi:hypothetical protein